MLLEDYSVIKNKMKNGASGLFKRMVAAPSSMAKSKTVALKSKAKDIKVRLIIFSLLSDKKFLLSSLTHKFQSLIRRHPHHNEELLVLEDGEEQSKATVQYNNANPNEPLPNSSHTQMVEEKENDFYECDENGVGEECPDLNDSVFEPEVLDSKEEAREELRLEDDIDLKADLFIKKFHRQMMLQRQQSFGRNQDMIMASA